MFSLFETHIGYAKFGKVAEAEASEDSAVKGDSGRRGHRFFFILNYIIPTRSSSTKR